MLSEVMGWLTTCGAAGEHPARTLTPFLESTVVRVFVRSYMAPHLAAVGPGVLSVPDTAG
jgi:hypothetical protein